MGYQTATLGDLEHAQRIVVAQCEYEAEHNAPCIHLIQRYRLGKGEKSITVPKVGQVTASDLTDGVDMVDEQDVGMSYVSLTPSEVGLKFILTDKLVRQFNEDVFRVIGQQMGDAMARKRDEDVIALFSALNGGTTLGADDLNLSFSLLSKCAGVATAKKYRNPIFIVHHPNALSIAAMGRAGIYNNDMNVTMGFGGLTEDARNALRQFFKMEVNGIGCYQDGNIDKISGSDSGYGAIFSKSAMAMVESLAPTTERERDASLRAWEINMVSDYGMFEIWDTQGAPMRYEILDLLTTSTK